METRGVSVSLKTMRHLTNLECFFFSKTGKPNLNLENSEFKQIPEYIEYLFATQCNLLSKLIYICTFCRLHMWRTYISPPPVGVVLRLLKPFKGGRGSQNEWGKMKMNRAEQQEGDWIGELAAWPTD